MKVIGLLMLSHEDDVLEEILDHNAPLVDELYVLDGTIPNNYSRSLCESHEHCCGYWADRDLPDEWGDKPRDGWRQWLYQAAVKDWGHDNWFVLLHGDEWWEGAPRRIASAHTQADGIIFRLPVYFPRDEWRDDVAPLEQLRWHLGPGWPELRMFRGRPDVQYDPGQHFNVTPSGIGKLVSVPERIRHYAYRSPEVQLARALRHQQTEFDPDNYAHVLEGEVIWTDATISRWQTKSCWRDLEEL